MKKRKIDAQRRCPKCGQVENQIKGVRHYVVKKD